MTQPPAQSNVAPGLCAQAENLHLAWSNRQKQLHTITSSNRGASWHNKTPLLKPSGHEPETSDFGPAICEFDGDLYVAWTGTDADAHLNVMRLRDRNKTVLSHSSAFGPALAVFNNQLFLAWVEPGSGGSLNIASAHGLDFGDKQPLGQHSIGPPALQVARASGGPGETLLLLAWTDKQQHLHIGGSRDGRTFAFGGPIGEEPIGEEPRLETSFTGPALLTDRPHHSGASTVYISWTGTDTRHLINTMASFKPEDFSGGFDPSTRDTPGNLRSLAEAGPSLARLSHGAESTFFVSYTREDNNQVEVRTISLPSSS
jgi:hypothetical protein